MQPLRDLLQRWRRRGPCPACATRAGAPLCDRCRTSSGIGSLPFTTVSGPRVLHFVGGYHACSQAGDRRTNAASGLSPLGRSLRAFKDHGDRYGGRCLAELFAASCASVVAGSGLLVPVPSDVERLRRRGLSPAAWLARSLAQRSGVALRTTALRRVPGRPAQRGLGGARRRANARGAFELGAADVRGYSVALVDDVVTTGATLGEAARLLHEAGATSVVLVVLACADDEVIAACRPTIVSAGPGGINTPRR